MPLSSASTDDEVCAAFDDNASFEEVSSAAKAIAFVTACRILLRRRPIQMSMGNQSTQFDASFIANEMARANKWLATNRAASGSGVRFLDFRGVRD